jgi:hypothetical protein
MDALEKRIEADELKKEKLKEDLEDIEFKFRTKIRWDHEIGP